MWTPSGQLDLTTFAGVRGGGGGKGGGSVNPPAPTYSDPVTGKQYGSQADLNAAIDARTTAAQQASDAAAATATQTAATNESNFQTSKANAIASARQQIEQSFRDAGVDPAAYEDSYIKPTLDRYANTIQDLSPNPQGAFPTTIGQDIVNQATTAGRNTATTAMNKAFAPTYTTDYLPDTSIDPYVSSTISAQFDPLQQALKNALARGTLTQTGYDAAKGELANQQAAGTSTVRDLAMGILGTDRTNLGDYISSSKNVAGSLNLGDVGAFSTDPYTTHAQSMVNTDLSNLGGAITSAVGGTQYGDLSKALNVGGMVQGANNPSATNPNALPGSGAGDQTDAAQQTIDDTKKRGISAPGAF